MPFGEDVYRNDGTVYTAGTPAGYGVVEVKKMLERRAKEKPIPIPPGFKASTLTFGDAAEKLCASVQAALLLKPDGVCGPTTMRAGFKLDLRSAAQEAGVEFELVCKLISLESGFNPSAYSPAPWPSNYANGTKDRGIGQINTSGGATDAEAFDALKALKYSAVRLAGALDRYDGQEDVAVASYNVGVGGAVYYEKGRDYYALFQKQVC